jgi:hypothetical protein
MKRISIFTATLTAFLSIRIIAMAQMPVPPPAPAGQLRSSGELDQILQPIALYPDPLIAQILPSATLPSEVVMADRYVSGGGDPNLIDQQPWDPSVRALARYPAVLKWMDDNLAWTTALGQAFLSQQQDVMNSIQRLRAQAQSLGNLQNTPQENIVTDNGEIEILPADPQIIYVPVYQPDLVYYQRWSHGSPFISFGVGFSLGAWLNLDFDWHNHHLIEWGRDHPRPGDWWARRPGERASVAISHATVWQPHRPDVIARGGDRGWDARQTRPAPVIRSEPGRPPQQPSRPAVIQHSEEAIKARPAEGALIGVQSSHETQQFSNRGQQSRQTMQTPAAPARSAAPVQSAGPSRSAGGPQKR